MSSLAVVSAGLLALFTSLGGLIGYARTNSLPSVAAGGFIGSLYLVSLMRLSDNEPFGEEVGLAASAILGASAIPRVIKTKGKPVPVGLSILATYGLLVFGLAFRAKKVAGGF